MTLQELHTSASDLLMLCSCRLMRWDCSLAWHWVKQTWLRTMAHRNTMTHWRQQHQRPLCGHACGGIALMEFATLCKRDNCTGREPPHAQYRLCSESSWAGTAAAVIPLNQF